jgi:hypothetical protein
MNDLKIKGWKQQFFEVKKIGNEPKLTPPPWRKFKEPEIKIQVDNKKS